MTYTISVNGKPVATVTGEGITMGKRSQFVADSYRTELVDDPRLLRLIIEGQTILVFYVASGKNIEVSHD